MKKIKRIFKWIGIILSGLIILILAVVAVAYIITNSTIVNKTYEPEYSNFSINDELPDQQEGIRLAKIRGCYGCHGNELQGAIPFEVPFMFKGTAPNLPVFMNLFGYRT